MRVVSVMGILPHGMESAAAVNVEMGGLCWRKSVTTTTVSVMMGVPVNARWRNISSVSMNPVCVNLWVL